MQTTAEEAPRLSKTSVRMKTRGGRQTHSPGWPAHRERIRLAGEAVDPHLHAFAAFALLDAQPMHGVGDRGQGTFVVEDRAARVLHQL